jgi:hypothetical protein
MLTEYQTGVFEDMNVRIGDLIGATHQFTAAAPPEHMHAPKAPATAASAGPACGTCEASTEPEHSSGTRSTSLLLEASRLREPCRRVSQHTRLLRRAVSISVVHALDVASGALLHSEHPDAIEARVVLIELCEVLRRYERPRGVPLMKRSPEPHVRDCLWCGTRMEPSPNPQKEYCCPGHRQRAYLARLRLAQTNGLTS